MDDTPSYRLGYWAASATAVTASAYVVGQLFEWAGALGSAGGPNSQSTPLGILVLLLPSLLLGSCFVVTIAALHQVTPPQRRAFSLSALAFATIYATLTGLVYFVQLTFVSPRLAAGTTEGIEVLLFLPYRSFLFAVDLFGYSLMCLSTLFAAWAIVDPAERTLRFALFANGLLVPFLALQMRWPWLIHVAAMWAIAFPLAAVLLARKFRRGLQSRS